ncbi:MAG: hypothetical protein J6328_01440 [Bacilli bacterium]|nr:hypothetical protein [Bacilli bacterium]
MKLGDLVDLLDKKTKISGAFIGGVMLAAGTSLPELFTSISSVLLVNNPTLVMGDILGSDIFDIVVMILLTFIFARNFHEAKVNKVQEVSLLLLIAMYGLAIYAVLAPETWQIMLGDINLISIIIFVGYIIVIWKQPKESEEEKEQTDSKLTVKQILILFFGCAALLIAASIGITYLTDMIVDEIPWLNGTVGGAVLLGVATSIPEIISTAQLFRRKNYDAGIGNMIGSCTFNFSIVSFADFVSWQGINGEIVGSRGIWIGSDSARWLIVLGAASVLMAIAFIAIKNHTNIIKSKRSSYIVTGLFAVLAMSAYILSLVL